jgi:cytochrome c-type biogenesis protein CcmH
MHMTFLLVAMCLTLVALALVLTPLLRERFMAERRLGDLRRQLRELNEANSVGGLQPAQYAAQRAAIGEALVVYLDRRPKHAAAPMVAALSLAIVVPLGAFGAYRWVGAPPGAIGGPTTAAGSHASAPEDPGGAGAAPVPVDHRTDMQASIARLADKLRQHPDDAQGWALLARTYKATQHYAEAREAFKHALEAAPGNAGLEREYAAAETPDAETAESADSADGQAVPQQCLVSDNTGDCTEPPAARGDSARIVVKVSLDPKLKAKVLPSDTLFVFAKAAEGPPMPLAIARLTAAQLPTSVTLSDAMSMMPNMTLSKFPQVILGARISKSGNAVAQSGDFQTLSAAVSNSRTEPIRLTIDRTVE